MKDFEPYEYVGVIAPGAVVAIGLFLQWPHARDAILNKDFTLGSFGVFIICCFILGHLVQGIGNALEALFFWPFGGLPTNLVLRNHQNLISPTQRVRLADRVGQMQSAAIDLSNIDKKSWYPITREIYATVDAAGRAGRVDAFNRTYGLLRGLAAALVLLAVWFIVGRRPDVEYVYATAALAILALFRMSRFARAYARELFIQYLNIPELPAT